MQSPFLKAFELLFSGDPEVYIIAWTSIRISLFSTFFTTLISLPLGLLLGLKEFRGKKAIIVVLNSLMALPTVVIGLLVYSLISRSGPLGFMGILFTPAAIVLGQTVLSFPIVTSMIFGALNKLDKQLPETLVTLGSSKQQIFWMTLRERKIAILSAVFGGFGRVIGEVGVSMMLGGNIRLYTRTLTTAIALETSKGEFALGIALGIILMIIAFSINFSFYWVFRHER